MGAVCDNCWNKIDKPTPVLHFRGKSLVLCLKCFIEAVRLLESEPEPTETEVAYELDE